MVGRPSRHGGSIPRPADALVGRDDLLGELTALADEAGHGSGSLVVLTGEAGIGKTSVVRALARSTRGDLAVTWGRCVPDGSAPPFWPWQEVLAEPAGALELTDEPADRPIGTTRFERLGELRGGLVGRARRSPALHVIEDLQWADVASVLLLAHVGEAIADAPLMIVATLRTGEVLGRSLEDALEEVRRFALVREIPSLRSEEIQLLIAAAELSGSEDLAAMLLERTGGNPLYVSELLRAVQAAEPTERRALLEGAVPARVSELVENRLSRLPDAVADLVFTASVVGTEGDARTLARVHEASVERVIDLVDQARAAHLVDTTAPGRWQFRHDLVRDAVYATGTDLGRARAHAAALDALAAGGSTPPAVLARHALAAQPLFDPERAVALAARAGESAFAQHGYEEAVAWFGGALDAAPADLAPRWRAELLVQCGEAHRHIGDLVGARRSFLAAADLSDDPALLARSALGYADPGADLGIAYRTEDPSTRTLLERAIEAQPQGDAVTTVLLEARLAAELYFSDDPGLSRVLAGSALDRARRLGDERALGVAGAVDHDAHVVGQADLAVQLRGSEQLFEWARADGSARALLTAHRARAMDLLAAGDLAAMDLEVLAFRRVAEPLKVPAYDWWSALWSAMRSLLEGRHDEAEARASAAHEIGRRSFPELAFTNLSFLLFFLRREQGRLAELEQVTRDYSSSHADVPAVRVALTFLLAEIGEVDEAQAMLRSLPARDLARLHDRNWPACWFQLARTAWIVGDRELAATLLDPADRPTERCVTVSLATVCLGATDLATAWLLHVVGDLQEADRCYRAAAVTNAAIGARSWLAQTRTDHAGLLLDRGAPGDVEAARLQVERASALAGDIGLASVQPVLVALRGRLDPDIEDGTTSGAAVQVPAVATFRRLEGVWELDFAGRRVQVPHARGLIDLARLLAHPGEPMSALELLDEPGAPVVRTRGAPVFDDRARREIRGRLQQLDAEVADADADGDGEREAIAREARRVLAETVARDFGLGGRPRLVGDPVERARKTVSTRLRRSIVVVGRSHPELGRHLERSIDTGTWCAYRPAEPLTWSL